jgi:putative nucleotidyltransferase with HDIG domain
MKMLKSDFPAEAIELLDTTGLLTHIIPELLTAKGVEQAGHHTTDVWTHSLDALRTCPSTDPIVRLATLLHDIAKPQTYQRTDASITFYNHEVIGARVAKKIAERLRLPKRDVERIFTLVRHHMFHYQPKNTDAAIRRFMRKVGLENIDDILDLREGDRLGSGARQTSWRLEEMKQRMIEQLNQPLSVHDLAIDGHDLMAELKLQPGPKLGQILHELFEKVLEQPELNTKEQLIKEAKLLSTSNE